MIMCCPYSIAIYSDFFAMKDCPYIEFGTLLKASDKCTSVVYRRAETAHKLGLTEHMLVELCILCGNDFSSEYPYHNRLYDDCPHLDTETVKSRFSTIMSYVSWLNTKDPNFTLSSAKNKELDIASNYSRAFYQLEDLTCHTKELLAFRKINNYVIPKSSMSVLLSSGEMSNVLSWVQANESGKSPGEVALQYMFAKSKLTIELNGRSVVTAPDHLSALSSMLSITTDISASYKENPIRAMAKALPVPTWGDVMVAHTFQCLAREISKQIPCDHEDFFEVYLTARYC